MRVLPIGLIDSSTRPPACLVHARQVGGLFAIEGMFTRSAVDTTAQSAKVGDMTNVSSLPEVPDARRPHC